MKDGYSFIELLVIIAILLSVGVVSTGFYSRFLIQNNVTHATDQIVGSLRKAQMYSMTSKHASGWSVRYGSNTLKVYKGLPANFGTRDTSVDENFSLGPSVTVTGLTDITFARVTGLPTPTNATITITGAGTTQTITINSQGVVNRQ